MMKTLMKCQRENCEDDKIVEKDKEDDGLEDEDILTGERLDVIENPNDNVKGKTVGDDKIVEKDKEDDGLEDEDILNGERLNGIKLSHKLSKSAKKEKKQELPQTSRGKCTI